MQLKSITSPMNFKAESFYIRNLTTDMPTYYHVKMNFYVFLLLCYLLNMVLPFKLSTGVQDKYRKYREKINKIVYKGKEEENTLFFNVNDYEYPRANETLKEIHKERWSDYYECLKMRFSQISSQKSVSAIALMALEGTSITLKCQICISPADINEFDVVDWYYSSHHDDFNSEKFVEHSENTLISPADYQLVMYNLKAGQAGRYWCKMGETLGDLYHLEIEQSRNISVVRPDEAPFALHATPEQTVENYNLRIYTTWTRWSECTACDIVGQKVRYGYCTISMLANSARTDVTQHKMKEDKTENEERKKSKLIHDILPIFGNKLPCKSSYTPENIQKLPEIKHRKTEMMFRYCKQSCPNNVVFEIRDKNGNVIESANNSAGIYSLAQGVPQAPPSVTQITLYKRHNKKAELNCPGNLNTDTPVVWKVGNKRVIPSVIQKQSAGRIRINPQMHIIFKKLRFIDSNIYSCWQNDELTGTIKLNVSGEIEVKFDHHVFLIGAIAIIGVFVILFWRAFKGRTRYTIH